MDKPISQRDYKNTPACNTCEHAWKNQKELKDSHCHFCGKSSCKECMKKTRLFRTKKTPCNDDTQRGRICKLCDRKFIIKDMIHGSSTQIKTQNLVIENSTKQYKELEREAEATRNEHDKQNGTITYHIERVENEVKKLEDFEMKNGEELENIAEEVEKCQSKQRLIENRMNEL